MRTRLPASVTPRVSNVDKHSKDDEIPVRLCNYVDVYKNARINERMTFMRATATPEEITRFRLESGDVLITKDSESCNDIGVPAIVGRPADDLICGAPSDSQSTAAAYQFHIEANGVTRYGLSHAAIKSVCLPLPPLSEQFAIVRFLDHADRRIRRCIRIGPPVEDDRLALARPDRAWRQDKNMLSSNLMPARAIDDGDTCANANAAQIFSELSLF